MMCSQYNWGRGSGKLFMHIQGLFVSLVCKFLLKSVNSQMIGHIVSSGLAKNLLKISLKTRGHCMFFSPLQKPWEHRNSSNQYGRSLKHEPKKKKLNRKELNGFWKSSDHHKLPWPEWLTYIIRQYMLFNTFYYK